MTTAAPATSPGLAPAQLDAYQRDGYVVLPGLIDPAECDAVVAHMADQAAGRRKVAGMPAIDTSKPNWGRTHNQHLYDPVAMGMLLHPRLRRPLADACGGAVDGVQTMYFWQGSEQRRHQDQYYLPGCFSAWIALVDVSPENGTIWVQPGSHLRKLVTARDLQDAPDKPKPLFGSHYDEAVDALYEQNRAAGLSADVPAIARKGDVVIFHGKLIHRGGPVGKPGSFRHVMANHYIPNDFDGWPHEGWPRFTFDGIRRLTKPLAVA
ncbi:MAG: phytanoyl-CoA dioxygenase family protein [Planctomycetota bacterium]|nr:phytanoyl-CoA dioxygenase family protein [Planctomycetota bacterium]